MALHPVILMDSMILSGYGGIGVRIAGPSSNSGPRGIGLDSRPLFMPFAKVSLTD
jgi:hypothetical protein